MAHITELHTDLLNLIFLLLATSDDGARHVARAGATCKELLSVAIDPIVLKVVNFQHLADTFDFSKHHHANGLLCKSAVHGNQAAQTLLGKALLLNDKWFWRMLIRDYHRSLRGRIEPHLVLHHTTLVRSFILHAPSIDIARMCQHLVNYVVTFVGYNASDENGLVYNIFRLCSYEAMKLREPINGPQNARRGRVTLTFGSFASVEVNSEGPRETLSRESVVELFNELFPLALG